MASVRYHAWIVLALLMLSGLSLMPREVDSDTANTDLYIDDDADFSTSPFVESGSGSSDSPYLIRNWNMGSHYIRLDDTTSHVLFYNITFTASGSWCFYLSNARNVVIRNVSATGRGRFLYSSSCNSIRVDDCNVTSIPTQTHVVDVRNGNVITISNSRFVHQEGETAAVNFNNQGSGQRFIGNYLDGIPFSDSDFNSDGYILNCTFRDSPVQVTDGEKGAVISGSVFDSPGENALTLVTSYFMEISENYFHGDAGIYFGNMIWQATNERGTVENNTFESCGDGIVAQNDYWSRPNKYEVHHNYFGNCSGYAIDWGYGMSNHHWKNIFYHNAGTDNFTAGSQCMQFNYQSLYKNTWTRGLLGNFWANHRTPDGNNDGIVDNDYSITNGGVDERPSTSRYFDTVPPTISVTEPESLYPDRSYLMIEWEAEDIGSGVDLIRMKVDNGPWIDVTSMESRSVFLEEGSHFIRFNITDRAGLFNTTSKQYIIEDFVPVITLSSPLDGDYLSRENVTVEWDLKDYFEVTNLSVTIDDDTVHLPTEQSVLTRKLEEGPHHLKVRAVDSSGLDVSRDINFTVDLTDPMVEVLSPQSGSTISNSYLRINYGISDNIGLSTVEVKIDDEDWVQRPIQETAYRVLLDDGDHSLKVRGTDRAGRKTSVNIPFSIGDTPLLRFKKPENGTSTRIGQVEVEWTYEGPFDWNRSLLKVGRAGEFVDTFGQKRYNISLDEDGAFEIVIRLEDVFGNYIEATTIVIKDTIPPVVGFKNLTDGQILNVPNLLLEWVGVDNTFLPIDKYLLRIDQGDWMDMGDQLSQNVEFGEGEHEIAIRAVDQAGNTGEESLEITFDLTDPQARILAPSKGSVIADSQVDIEFEAADNYGIDELTLVIDGKINITVTGKTFYTTTIGTDGSHNISLIARDMAANVYSTTVEIRVDLTHPFLEWVNGPDRMISSKNYVLSWNATDVTGIHSITLTVDGKEEELVPEQRSVELNLTEGVHQISLLVVDGAGLESSLGSGTGLMVDLTPPDVSIDETRSGVQSNTVQIFWNAEDRDGSGIGEILISIDGGEFEKVPSELTYTHEGLSLGEHSATLRVFDKAGNHRDVTWDFMVDISDGGTGDGDPDDGSNMALFIGIGAAILVLFILIAFVVIRKRKRNYTAKERAEEKRKGLSRPGKIKMDIPPPPAARSLPPEATPVQDTQKAPPKAKVEETETGSGYIRPERKKKKKKRKPKHEVLDIGQEKEKSVPSPQSEEDVKGSEIGEDDMSEDEGHGDMIPLWDEPSGSHEYEVGVSGMEKEEETETETGQQEYDGVTWDEDDADNDEMEEFQEMEELEELEDLDDLEEIEEIEGDSDVDELEEWG